MSLSEEIAFFEKNRSGFLKEHEGKYALIKGSACLGFYDDAEAAFEAGVQRLGAVEFLIKQVLREDRIDISPALACGLLNASA